MTRRAVASQGAKGTKMTLGFFDRFRTAPPAPAPLVFAGLSQVRAYWEGLRPPGALPQRAAVDPRGLVGVLDRVFLADRIGRGLVSLRIAGSGLAAFAGDDLRGLPLSCLFASESRPLLAQTVERVLAEDVLAELDLGADRGKTGQTVARMLLLPLADGPDRTLILGAVGFGETRPVACKLQILARCETQVLPPPAPKPVPSLTPAPTRRGHLTLVHARE